MQPVADPGFAKKVDHGKCVNRERKQGLGEPQWVPEAEPLVGAHGQSPPEAESSLSYKSGQKLAI